MWLGLQIVPPSNACMQDSAREGAQTYRIHTASKASGNEYDGWNLAMSA